RAEEARLRASPAQRSRAERSNIQPPRTHGSADRTSEQAWARSSRRSRRSELRAFRHGDGEAVPHTVQSFRARTPAESEKACPAAHHRILCQCNGPLRQSLALFPWKLLQALQR